MNSAKFSSRPSKGKTFILFIVLGLIIQPQFFERTFYFNEILSILGMFAARKFLFSKVKKQRSVKIVYLLILWGGIQLLISMFTMDDFYAFMRHTSIIYSIFCFFLAAFLYKEVKYWFYKAAKVFRVSIALISFIPIPGLVYRLSVLYIYPLLVTGGKIPVRFLYILGCIILLTLSHGGGSGIISILVASVIYVILKSPTVFWTIISSAILLLAGLYIYYYEFFVISETAGALALYRFFPLLAEDPNSLIRTYFWHLSINRMIDSYGIGIGFGTQLFDLSQIPLVFESDQKTELLPYFLFPHNSFLGVLARLGVVGLLLLILLLIELLNQFSRKLKEIDAFSFSILTVFSFLIAVSSLNVVIESPITSGVFWFFMGLTFRCGQELNTKHEMN
ncbi:MAG: O-antigen ligase family protein [Cycloclasticus sp.]